MTLIFVQISKTRNPLILEGEETVLHHFGIKDSIKDITLGEIFKMMYKNDFSEPAHLSRRIMMSSKEVSEEDRTFLYILEKETEKR